MHLQGTFPSFVGSSAVMDKAVTALSVAFLAKAKLDSDMLVYSTRLYGQTLQIVHSRIRSGRKCGPDVLYATVILQIYEVCLTSNVRMLLSHLLFS